MKKATELKNYIQRLIEKLIPSEKPNPIQNQEQIMTLLFYSNFTKLSTEQSITIFQNVKDLFDIKILNLETALNNEKKAIDNYKLSKQQRLEKIVNDPVFEYPINNHGFSVEFVKKD